MSDVEESSVSSAQNIAPALPESNKRKRDETVEAAVEEKTSKRSKKRKNKKATSEGFADADLDTENGVNAALGKMDGSLLADYVAQRTKRFEGELSLVELEDRRLPEKAIRDTTSWEKPRTTATLPDFLEHYAAQFGRIKPLSKAPKEKGSPHTLVVTGAGLRAADLTRVLRKFQTKEATIGKLFAKHIKLKEAVKFVKQARIGIAVGTPARLIDLIDEGALSMDKLERIVIDSSHIDQKKRGILDMKDTQIPLLKFLNRPEVKSRYGATEGGVELLFY
ncbi:hypothetical protein L228DRAFT_245179 [Xylona heveae TC161]|uniref:Protein CMS1 n=1 Tax=Xylona heveae (strain CBS 132557 / TC161) TaxID=1328760 RepID=A0A165I2F2_XYLHT|nr:hypothetical protein L228DRAFT_245179 [Xylona heveae TC161]KZF24270.1 hypothetical protein L228DRAFT_245179 [Xylona heveae TC161]